MLVYTVCIKGRSVREAILRDRKLEDHGLAVRKGRKVGRKPMMEMLLLGEPVPAVEAQRLGLVNRCVPDDALDATVAQIATKLVGKSALALRLGKEAFYRQLDMDLESAYAYCSEVMTPNMMAADAEEGIDAFLEKRPPVWQDR